MAVDALEQTLKARGVEARRLQTSHAFHSSMMEPILAEFTALVAKVKRSTPTLPYVSNLTGTWITPAQAKDPAYWAQHLRGAVRFTGGVAELLKDGDRVGLEVGPGRTLSTLARQRTELAAQGAAVTSLPHPQEKTSDALHALAALGKLWIAGVEIDWAGFSAGERRRRVPLPTYPFDRQRYWVQAKAPAPAVPATTAVAKPVAFTRQADLADWFYVPVWREAAAPAATVAGGRQWLVLADAGALRDALATRLRADGESVTLVETAPAFSLVDDAHYAINPGSKEEFAMLLTTLRGEQRFPDVIVHAWSEQPATGDALANFERTQTRGFYSLLFLAQALGDENLTKPLHLGVVTTGLQSVKGEPIKGADRATLIGPCKVIAQEYPEIASTGIDVAGTPAEMAAAVIAE